ncbi:Predicted nucleotidyltransferase [Modicisalibacter ilicicola DSM 19980]|uniref:Predicted nucleotidyltransferase n=1 Tax=Modicisalibacter ilicicola DSM 19980 TaxID=1121942 RepID=A0A1M4YXS8_9GAMM|nr:nucleotidyltransferase domain-containing protein [Halomonas ilicicola]SHF10624.1 Predicted nucleotidyltransferase [Halomonas ilicicola DSM 19980]
MIDDSVEDSQASPGEPSNKSVAALGRRIIRALAGFSEIEQIVLFGSLSRGAGRPDSDIDVAVEADKPLTSELRIAMIEALAMEFGRPVDLVDLKAAGQPLLTQIVTTGKRLLGSDTRWANVIYRNIIENEDCVPLQRRILIARQNAWINR